MSPRSKLLGDGRGHGLGGGSVMVATSTPRQGEHAFDATGLCPCGARVKLAGVVLYMDKHGGGWTQTRPLCSVVWQ